MGEQSKGNAVPVQPLVIVPWFGIEKQPASPGRLRAQRKQLLRLLSENVRVQPDEPRCDACGRIVNALVGKCQWCEQ